MCARSTALFAVVVFAASTLRGQCFPGNLQLGSGVAGVWGSSNNVLAWDPDGDGPLLSRAVIHGGCRFAGTVISDGAVAWNTASGFTAMQDVNVYAIDRATVHAGNLYASGRFHTPGNGEEVRVVQWSGNSWQPVGVMSGAYIGAIASFNGSLFVGGRFQAINGHPLVNAAEWTGTQWRSPGGTQSFPGSDVYCFEEYQNTLVAADTDGRLYRFGGTWQQMTYPVLWFADVIRDMLADGDDLYIVGDLYPISGSSAGIGRWDGQQWRSVGSGLRNGSSAGTGGSIGRYHDGIVVTGMFDSAGGVPARAVARLDGDSWSAMGQNTPEAVWDTAEVDGQLVAVGWWRGGASGIEGAARWSGEDWVALENGSAGAIADATTLNSDVYVSGYFRLLDGVSVTAVAKRTGSTWAAVGNTDAWGHAGTLLEHGGALYAEATPVAGGPLQVLRWNGAQWNAIAQNIEYSYNPVMDMAWFGGSLVMGGNFDAINGAPIQKIARWNGSSWSAMGTAARFIWDLQDFNGTLYAAGSFMVDGEVLHGAVGRWDGSEWHIAAPHPTGNSFDYVLALAEYRGRLLAAGQFASGDPPPGVAVWELRGSLWEPMFPELYGYVEHLTVADGRLYAAGWSDVDVDPATAGHLVMVSDGANWHPLDLSGSGAPAIAPFGQGAFFGGSNLVSPEGVVSGLWMLWQPGSACCDFIDFNMDTLFPDTQDIGDFLNVLSGGACAPPNPAECNADIDFNNDGIFPDAADIDTLLRVFSGGAC